MTDVHPNGTNGNGTKLPVLPVLFLLGTATIGALTSWLFKLDDRMFELTRDVPTRPEIHILRAELTTRLDRIDTALSSIVANSRVPVHP